VQPLAIYLRDHLAISTAGLELAKRTQHANRRHADFGAPLATVRDELEADRLTLLELMRRLGVEPDRVKEAAAWSAEKLGRLKLNGRLTGYSPLSRVLELEALAMALAGQRRQWEALGRIPGARLDGVDVARMLARTDEQAARVGQLHARATELAFATPPS
jgi:hypothetical protein